MLMWPMTEFIATDETENAQRKMHTHSSVCLSDTRQRAYDYMKMNTTVRLSGPSPYSLRWRDHRCLSSYLYLVYGVLT